MKMSSTGSSRKRRRRSSSHSSPEPVAPPLDQLGTPLALESQLDTLLLRCVDAGFAFLILVVPFIMGGREAPGQLALVCSACWIAGCWGLLQMRQREARWTLSLAEPLIAAGVALVILQIVHLPLERIQSLSPKLGELLSGWQGTAGSRPWDQLSLMPAETLDSLMVLIAYVLIFVVAMQRLRTQNDVYRLMVTLAVAATGMAVFGLLQYAASNGKFFWFYENPFTDTKRVVKGAFTNRNHFANFLALGVGPLLWCLTAASVRSKNAGNKDLSSHAGFGVWLVVVALSVVVFATLLSLSRGGSIAMGIACAVGGFAIYRSSIISGQLVFAGVVVMAITCGLIAAHGEDQIQKRLDQIASADVERLDNSDGRRIIWAANIAGIKDFPSVGTGVGTHREVYPMYMEESGQDDMGEFTHAENGYLQVCLETGKVGLGMLLIGFLFAICWTFRGLGGGAGPLIAAAQAAALASLLASLAHSGADFVWYVPACVVPVLLLAASACRCGQLQKEDLGRMPAMMPVPRLAWALAGVGALALAVWMVPAKYRRVQAQHHWYAFQRITNKRNSSLIQNSSNVFRNRLVAVSRTISADPSMARPHAKMAKMCMQAFLELQEASENPMPLAEIRNVARMDYRDDWAGREEWLGRVFEERGEYLRRAVAHARKSLELCPLQGEVYLYLSELDFLDADTDWDNQKFVAQAIQVRPHEPKVLLVSGQQKLLAALANTNPSMQQQEVLEALEPFKRAFKLSPSLQSSIIGEVAVMLNAPVLVQLFEPDVEALAFMAERYRQLGRWRDVGYSLDAFTKAAFRMADEPEVPVERQVRFLLFARKACDELRDTKRAEECFAKAAELSPRDFRIYYQHGVWLAEREQFAQAAEQFRICTEIRPGDGQVRRLSLAMQKRDLDLQLEGRTRMATQPPQGFGTY